MTGENGHGSSRSEFLKQAAGATIVVASAGVGAAALAEPAAAVLFNPKEFKYLELDGVNVGRLAGASGGDYGFEVVIADFDADGNPDKLLGPTKHSNFTIEVGAGMGKPLQDWIDHSFDDPTVRKNGAIVSADFNRNEIARRTFTGAQITEFTVPRLVNRPQAFPAVSVTFTADSVSDDTPSGAPVIGAKQKAWLTSNFKFECPGLSGRIASIDSFTWKRTQPAGSSAQLNNPSDLTVLLEPSAVPSWTQWYDNFALSGASSDERDATLTIYGQSPSVPLIRCDLHGLGIFQLTDQELSTEKKAKVYVSKGGFNLQGRDNDQLGWFG